MTQPANLALLKEELLKFKTKAIELKDSYAAAKLTETLEKIDKLENQDDSTREIS